MSVTAPVRGFECDIDPCTHNPRIRFNFANGLTASVVVHAGANGMHGAVASLAVLRDRKVVERGQAEAFPDEVAVFLAHIAAIGKEVATPAFLRSSFAQLRGRDEPSAARAPVAGEEAA